MAGLTHLSDFFVKKGKDFIQDLLNKEVTITEKVDGSNFNVRKLDDGFEYYKRDGKTPIGDIDRTLSIYHERPIEHFESLGSKVDKIPTDTYFSLEYFPSNRPVEVYYHKIPKNSLVLETVKLPNGNYVYDQKELDKWADLLEVERVPIIFQGKLSSKQKDELLKFVATPFEQLVEKYKSQSFSRFIITLLNPTMETSFLKASLDDMIEGVVFNFKGDDKDIFAKVVDPAFTEMARKKSAESKKPNDIYGVVVSDITDYINTLNLRDFSPRGNTFSEKYIDLMSQLFLKYFDERGDEYATIKFDIPDFLKKPEHAINYNKIQSKEIIRILKSNKNYEELYKMFLAAFRKKKKRAYGYFTKDFIQLFNQVVDKIHDYISSLNEITLEDIKVFALINEEEEILDSYNIVGGYGDVSIIEIPEYLQNDAVNEFELVTEPAEKPVNVVVGRFQPIHRGHISISKFLKDANGYDSIYIAIRGKKPNIKSPITVETQKKIFEEVAKNENAIHDFLDSNRVLFNEVFSLLRSKGYEPMSLGAGDDRMDTYKEQLDFMLNKRDNMMNVHQEFDVIQIPRNIIKVSGTMVRNSIIEKDKKTFEFAMPKYLYKFYDDLVNEIVMTYEIDGLIEEIKLAKPDKDGLYSIKHEGDKTIIKFNPVLKDTINKKLNKYKYKEI